MMMACGRSSTINNNSLLVLEKSYFYAFLSHWQRSSFLTFRVQSLFYAFKTVRMLLVEPCANFNYFSFDLLKTPKREECYLAICFGVASDVNKINPRPPKSLPCPTQQTDSRRLFPSHFHLALRDQLSWSHSEHLTHASPQWFLLSLSPSFCNIVFLTSPLPSH